ncbi:MAG: hypothetical protein CGU28_09870 [Candidatus Dactylopiibacterium carminicum]|uniref:Metal-dependent hydrolase n=1 Tax=Candidatus Dactylopiibacterium carminicum TaxID=857335 RepID=A0A272ERJ5_9RHOO|nr:hypothetical protein [Candidatus Dactylopiibacterium carminicum]KAF7598816.1 hypothetical protein BGI27_11190 [Candidatus Dactylopiibacterium carminicum]PAS92728.1 MAG: hypothetical protein CGU29_10460 [Candidatus Dactylopiibacterium carminicum]PAS96176.1 MAG: hypothetical protein CGU28_09870 [Candidatus Dactylopiibacterium carminicum]
MSAETRSIVLGGQPVAYMLRRSARRSLGLTIDQRGLTVAIPLQGSVREAEAFMLSRAGWIIEKLAE